MGRIWMPGGGGGADLDAVTAGAGNVEAGKVIVGPDGEPISGAVPNLSQNPDAQYATGNGTPVIKGDAAFMQVNTDNVNRALIRYDGASERGKAIIQPNTLIGIPAAEMAAAGGLTAAKLAQGQTAFGLTGTYKGLGNAVAADVRRGKTFSTASLSNATGTMTEQGGSTTTPGTAAKTIVAANRYVTGNIIVAGDGNLKAENIKKNVTIFGVKGTCEGWFPTATDIYLRGQNISIDQENSGSSWQFNSGAIQYPVLGSSRRLRTKTLDLTPYNNLNIEFQWVSANFGAGATVGLAKTVATAESDCLVWVNSAQHNNVQTISLNISNIYESRFWYIFFGIREGGLNIFHIWLS